MITIGYRWAGAAVAALVVLAMAGWMALVPRYQVSGRDARGRLAASRVVASGTSRADLNANLAALRARLVVQPRDAEATVRLADALLRQARVTGSGAPAIEAETALRAVLREEPADYDARRMLAAVLLSQHRFADARAEAARCRDMQPRDAWPYGVLGDAHIEMGEYEAAFDAFDRMLALRPDAGAYARASYARELQGDLDGALRFMRMAAEATPPHDVEAVAWHSVQIGHLREAQGDLTGARREFARADHLFPGHPLAGEALARLDAREGRHAEALTRVRELQDRSPSASVAGLAGDLLQTLGQHTEAERQYMLAESAWRMDTPEPARLARFLAERNRHVDDAIRLLDAEPRHDIFTEDARAWAYFRAGRLADAQHAITQALRTGSRDRVIRFHAAAIAHAAGETRSARAFIREALSGAPGFDLIAGPEAEALRQTLDVTRVARR